MPKQGNDYVLPGTKIDWKQYYLEFKAKHGSDPVLFEDRLLFRDGWRYSSTSYKGPEYAPPADPWLVWELKKMYWQLRKKVASEEIPQRQAMLERLENLQRRRDVPIPTRLWDLERQCYLKESEPMSLLGLEHRIQELQQDVQDSDERLAELNDTETEEEPLTFVDKAAKAMRRCVRKLQREKQDDAV